MRRLLAALALVCGLAAPARAAVTCSTSTDAITQITTSTNGGVTMAASATAGDFIMYYVGWTTNETSTLSAGPTTAGETWAAIHTALDHPNTTMRYLSFGSDNVAAASHAVATTISDAVSGRALIISCTGASTLAIDNIDAGGSFTNGVATQTTDALSSTAARDGAIIMLTACNSGETLSTLGTDVVTISGTAGERVFAHYRPFTGGASGLTMTFDFASVATCTTSAFIILESAGGATPINQVGPMMKGIGD